MGWLIPSAPLSFGAVCDENKVDGGLYYEQELPLLQ